MRRRSTCLARFGVLGFFHCNRGDGIGRYCDYGYEVELGRERKRGLG